MSTPHLPINLKATERSGCELEPSDCELPCLFPLMVTLLWTDAYCDPKTFSLGLSTCVGVCPGNSSLHHRVSRKPRVLSTPISMTLFPRVQQQHSGHMPGRGHSIERRHMPGRAHCIERGHMPGRSQGLRQRLDSIPQFCGLSPLSPLLECSSY